MTGSGPEARIEEAGGGAGGVPDERQSSWRLLTSRNFGPYFLAGLVSNCGTWVHNVAQAVLMYRLTESAFLVGVVNFSQFAAVVLLASLTGNAADRFDRRRLLIATQAAAFLVTLGLAVTVALDAATPLLLVVFAFGIGVTVAFAHPAQQALLPALVPKADLAAAVALNSVTFTMARALGALGAAVLIARSEIAVTFALNSLTYVVMIGGLLVIRPLRGGPAQGGRTQLRETARTVGRDPAFAALFLVLVAAAVTVDPVSTLAPAFAQRIYGAPDALAGYLVGAFGAGAALAAAFVTRRATVSFRWLAATLVLMIAGMLGFSLSTSPVLGCIFLAIAGFGFLAGVTAATTMIHLRAEDGQRGRLMSLRSVAFIGPRPLASLADGALAETVGLRAATVGMSVPAVLAVAWLVWFGRPARAGPTAPDPVPTSHPARGERHA